MRQLLTLDIVLAALTVMVKKELRGAEPSATVSEVYTFFCAAGIHPSVSQLHDVMVTFLPHEESGGTWIYKMPWCGTHDNRREVNRKL